ncbi:MAG: DASS family sodium-coupled anion symporter [Longimonas sp.]|uniref:SLC13 family permease n=1 Tax=Longimonas sp. TaxID=2039626 RepID=UPI00335BE93B
MAQVIKERATRLFKVLSEDKEASRRLLWFVISIAVWSGLMLMPTPEALGIQGQRAVALLAAVCIMFATEAIPLPAIGLLIPVYQVMIGGMSTDLVTGWMMSNALLFLMGTLMLVAALSSRGLDKIIALYILTSVGTSVYAVVFGIVAVSALLAGFMSDAAAALMLAPVLGMISIVRDSHDGPVTNLTKLLIFAVGFGAIVGSPYTPAGGARNVIMIDYMQQLADLDIGFAEWTLYMMPFTIIMVGVLTVLLPVIFPPEVEDLRTAVESLRTEVQERPFGLDQAVILVVFAITIVLWLTIGGQFGIGIIAVGAAAVLLVLGVVEWRNYQSDVDWGVLMIYIGAISLGGYTAETGAATWIANSFLDTVRDLGLGEGNLLVMVISFLITGMTSAMSAGATSSVMGPIVLEIGAQAAIPSIVVGLTTALASSFGFMLIVSTPGNAIIYASGYLSASDFIKAGLWAMLSAFAVFLMMLLFYWPLLT